MAEQRRWWVTALVVLVLVAGVAVTVLALSTGDGGDDEPVSDATALPSELPAVRPDPGTWCRQFRAFTDANTAFVDAPGAPTADALVEEGIALLELGQPLGLDDGGLTSLRQLVGRALGSAGGPSEVPPGAPGDPASLDGYLRTTCPV